MSTFQNHSANAKELATALRELEVGRNYDTVLSKAADELERLSGIEDIADNLQDICDKQAIKLGKRESCSLCDCTGDIHDATGEWRGTCPYCSPDLKPLVDALKDCLESVQWRIRAHEAHSFETSEEISKLQQIEQTAKSLIDNNKFVYDKSLLT
ncbi:MAG TPA: hypothetical protein VFM18_13405 [Methanosarcina sp.]|nr:hypothetical protein [Methanosarcina sp.]